MSGLYIATPVRKALRVAPSGLERSALEEWTLDSDVPSHFRLRAQIVLMAAEGRTNQEISSKVGVNPATVGLWRQRYAVHGLEGLRQSAPRASAPPARALVLERRILKATRTIPPPGGVRWTTRSLARYLGVSHMQVHRAWKRNSISTTAASPFRVGPSPLPWVDIVGFFRCPPVKAILFAMDETGTLPRPGSSSNGAGDSSRLLRVHAPGSRELNWGYDELRELVPERRVPVATRHDQLIFLRSVERRCDPGLRFHLILEGPEPGTQDSLREWLARRPRFETEFVTSSVEWREAVDRFLQKWNSLRLSRASFQSVGPFAEALARFAGSSSPSAAAFTWSLASEKPDGIGRIPSSPMGSAPDAPVPFSPSLSGAFRPAESGDTIRTQYGLNLRKGKAGRRLSLVSSEPLVDPKWARPDSNRRSSLCESDVVTAGPRAQPPSPALPLLKQFYLKVKVAERERRGRSSSQKR